MLMFFFLLLLSPSPQPCLTQDCCFVFFVTSSPCPRMVVRSRGKRAATSRAPNADDSGSKRFNTVKGIIGQKIRDNFLTMSPSETDCDGERWSGTPRAGDVRPCGEPHGKGSWRRFCYGSLRLVDQEETDYGCRASAERVLRCPSSILSG